ncbi:MAG: hypothetical protein M3P26_15610 [Gemmatimonadota bacterium]|nr:hypothetical protein [Gemmatimonadota bacterium]
MAEILVKFDEPIATPRGGSYFAQAAGREVDEGLWEGWIEFLPVAEEGNVLESGRETTQPNRANLEYWTRGLSKVYLEGALARAISLAAGPREIPATDPEPARFTAPAPRRAPPSPAPAPLSPRPVLDPFQVYAQGEEILRGELNALSRDHIESIVTAYRIDTSRSSSGIESPSTADLIETIVGEVRGNQLNADPDSGESQARL